mgnify:FL=1
MKSQLNTNLLGIGEALEEPVEITGGLLHKMYRVCTAEGVFAVKVLNSEIMKRPGVLENTIRSEKIAAFFSKKIPAVTALEVNGEKVCIIDGKFYMVFPWVEGNSVFPPEIQERHCAKIGEILGIMHKLAENAWQIKDTEEMMPMYKWERYLPEISVQDETWAREFCKIVPKLILWNKSACEAGNVLRKCRVISHRDLDPKNVMWDGMNPYLIDWEAAGPVNPYQEFLEVALYWADDGRGSLNRECFDALLEAYTCCKDLKKADWDIISAGGCSGMLGWLAYNIKRALGIEVADDAEILLGKQEVEKAIRELNEYQEKIRLIQKWME